MQAEEFFEAKDRIEGILYEFGEMNVDKGKSAGAYVVLDEYQLCGSADSEAYPLHVSVVFHIKYQNNDYDTATYKLPLSMFGRL